MAYEQHLVNRWVNAKKKNEHDMADFLFLNEEFLNLNLRKNFFQT